MYDRLGAPALHARGTLALLESALCNTRGIRAWVCGRRNQVQQRCSFESREPKREANGPIPLFDPNERDTAHARARREILAGDIAREARAPHRIAQLGGGLLDRRTWGNEFGATHDVLLSPAAIRYPYGYFVKRQAKYGSYPGTVV